MRHVIYTNSVPEEENECTVVKTDDQFTTPQKEAQVVVKDIFTHEEQLMNNVPITITRPTHNRSKSQRNMRSMNV